MMKRATLFWMLLAATAGGGLFILKYEVQALEDRLATINRDVMENLEAMHVLKAEWAYLNQPSRLEDLGRRLLEMEPVSADQMVNINDIPLRTPDDAAPEDVPEKEAAEPPENQSISPLLAGLKRAP